VRDREAEAAVVAIEHVPERRVEERCIGVDLELDTRFERRSTRYAERTSRVLEDAHAAAPGAWPTCMAEMPKVCSLYDTPTKPAAPMRSARTSGVKKASTDSGRYA